VGIAESKKTTMPFDSNYVSLKLVNFRRWTKILLRQLARTVDHEDVINHALEEGQMSGRFVFMVVMSCAIATLGLLLSSPAVIIGAMLISPLMGPIMLMGFSLSIFDFAAMRRAIFSLAWGVVAAIAISYLIVRLSPLSEATPEIIARTRPNFFDLLVAIFSGLAGGYATINRKGETIVGVAIATALMPPLAVTGYGLAVGAMGIAGGAFFLFMTNLLAIALSVTVLSRLYSFGSNHGRRSSLLQSAMIVCVFGALSIPLGLSLGDIAYESRAINTVKARLLMPFEDGESRISDVAVSFPRKQPIKIDATVLTKSLVPSAEASLATDLSSELGRPITINLAQVLVDEDKELEAEAFLRLADSSIAAPLRMEMSKLQQYGQRQQTEAELRAAIPFQVAAADINADTHIATLIAKPQPGLTTISYRTLETGLASNFPDWTIAVVPPMGELPLIGFDNGNDTVSPSANALIDDILWVLGRWSVTEVEAVGFASTSGEVRQFDNRSLALRRARNIAMILEEKGLKASAIGEYRAYQQTTNEKQHGYQRYQTVLIRPVG
jgi:uncharacterized hydrophobic protein (TIGR00271 family)